MKIRSLRKRLATQTEEFGLTMAENAKISVLDLSKPATFDLDDAARQFRAATRECGFLYVRMDNRAANYISSLRAQQRLFFAQSPDRKEAISIDQINRGYLGMGKAQMHGAKRTDQKEVFFWGREAGLDDPDVIDKVPLCGPCLLYTSPSLRDLSTSRMPSST